MNLIWQAFELPYRANLLYCLVNTLVVLLWKNQEI